ncbi:twin transmembrane helix small protein [Epibacterium ulvae]|uniref:twin transmembrane helix small protein n=1 Tax=Epibacterium ulvae TaxID=1156985 RepID=UPI001BFC4812|nr:twin transmembrane helix small protein [Epibacterium ulvae]MBT8153408.1 twin transmembrane helix small protein [Epibacterium ulvae]
MTNLLYILGVLGIGATVVALVIGIGSFGMGGKFHKNNANKLMRLRLICQFVAIAALLGFMYLRRQIG